MTLRLSDVDGGRANNLDIIRFVAASAVIFSHAFNLKNVKDPVDSVIGMGLGHLAVAVFFCISGYLITRSLVYRKSLIDFSVARVLRIFPALIVANLFVIIVVGLSFTSLSAGEYLSAGLTWKYFVINSTLLTSEYSLPGVFTGNAYPNAVNGSLWTLPVEMRMYALVFVAGLIALVCRMGQQGTDRVRVWALASLFVAVFAAGVGAWTIAGLPVGWPVTEGTLELSAYFAAGVFFYLARRAIPIHGGLAAVALVLPVVLHESALWALVWPPCLAYLCMWVGYTDRIRCYGFAKYGDFSYGIYIYAFPIQQSIYALWPEVGSLWNACATFVVALGLAYGSWHLIEKRAIAWKKPLTAWINQRLIRQSDSIGKQHS